MKSSLFMTNLAVVFAYAHPQKSEWQAKRFNNIVTFGDSYTDENRLGYFGANNGSAPPVGLDLGVGLNTATGGRTWARIAADSNNARLYNYAVAGAVCSNKVSPRTWATINAPFPDIEGYEVPAFLADSKFVTANGTKFFTGTRQNTVYTIWIGTNDLGNGAFLTNAQIRGKTLADYSDCVYSAVASLYKNGARYFVINNNAPLNLLPQYALPEDGGLAATKFFPDKPANITAVNYRIKEEVATTNQVYAYRSPYEALVNGSFPGIKIANYDVNSLITDIYNNPSRYLNGTAPLNVQSYINKCAGLTFANCTRAANPDSYLWFDELHPSEQASRVIAREYVGVLNGKSKWAKYWG